ncbi:bifunctional glycosyltransferase/CDP-glycerol:glycerophosphate glycerophosphotransferase [Nocardiopsis deserti]|uniref:bifunctional glycosyltransferase/CDP-glycerol:glycerophosphate glycerophosphotransferase n=1 Tax=Nocardiopsis deserti TaxID=2605988 RepID=UPI0012387D75|nr:bifunctional glycosyltransferase family 2 protein/CDP-glycerol:glycerophosphate glycerophosphotransferase [Nocardiopsis deserti]
MSPKLSVVVPFYNVEEYFDACLASVARQTLGDLEVVMVDDGSPDQSLAIAERWAARDERFRVVRQENQGLGPARNTGARHARGEYLAFLDSDDVLPVNAYELLVSSLEKTGSDFASGNVVRFNSRGTYPSDMHQGLFRNTRLKTHVSKENALLRDRIACNKVFRTSFWRAEGFEFPPGRYEDVPVIVPAHAQARSVDILRHTVYHYRAREGGNASITQQRTDPANMRARVLSVTSASQSLGSAGHHALRRAYDSRVLVDDFWIFMRLLPLVTEEFRQEFAELVIAYVDKIDPGILDELPASSRLQYWLLRNGRMEELMAVIGYGRGVREAVRHGGHWYGNYPYFQDPETGIPDDVYRLDQELTLRTVVTELYWRADRLHLSGYAAINHIGAPSQEANRITLRLKHTRLGLTKTLPVRQFADPTANNRIGQSRSVEWSAFETTIDLSRLRVAGMLVRGTWEVTVQVQGQGVTREGPLGEAKKDGVLRPAGAYFVGDSTRVLPTFEAGGRFMVRVEKKYALHRRDWIEDGHWHVECELPRGGTIDEPVLEVVRRVGSLRHSYPMTLHEDADGRRYLGASVPVETLVSFPGTDENTSEDESGSVWSEELDWELRVVPKAKRSEQFNLVVSADFEEHRVRVGRSELVVTRSKHGALLLVDRLPRMVIQRYRWTDTGTLHMIGDYNGDPEERPTSLQLRKRLSHLVHSFPVTWVDNTFTVKIEPGRTSAWGEERGLPRGRWDLVVHRQDGTENPVMLNRHLGGTEHDDHRHHRQRFTILPRRLYEMSLRVQADFTGEEGSGFGRLRLRDELYPRLREEPLRDMVLFESYFGKQFSCNPKAVYEELRARNTEMELVWATDDGSLRIPDGGRTVLIGSAEHLEALAQARFIVSNCGIQHWYVKREGQVYLQTWHGSPLKKVGLDVSNASFDRAQERLRRLADDAQKWDVLLSQSAFTTPIMRRAMAYEGEVAEIGYPRNDALHAPDADERAKRVREALGIAPDKRVVLYAPTWRDEGNTASGTYQFDLRLDIERMREKLGEDHVVLLRLHHLINRHHVTREDEFVKDVSSYPDVNDLCLASDVLISDYSSLMFDYAGTGRPILVYGYDYEQYRDHTRGLSFDLEEYGPGPILRDTGEIVEALVDLEGHQEKSKKQYETFRELFCPHEDGKSAARAVDLFLSRR